jgi:small subunit ribosomal protein S36
MTDDGTQRLTDAVGQDPRSPLSIPCVHGDQAEPFLNDGRRFVLAATAAFGCLLLAYSFLTPQAEAPDEASHVDLIFRLARGQPYPPFDNLRPTRGAQAFTESHRPLPRTRDDIFAARLSNLELRDLTEQSGERRRRDVTYRDLGGATPVKGDNQLSEHPPLFYVVSAGFVRLERAVLGWRQDAPMEREWALLRLFCALVMLPLPALCWAASTRIGTGTVAAAASSLVPLGVPQLLHVGSSVNNDSLFIMLAAAAAVPLAGVVRGDLRRGPALWTGLFVGLALLTKAFAVVLPIGVALAYFSAWRNTRTAGRDDATRLAATRLAQAGGLAFAIGAWWYIRNLARYGRPAPSIYDLQGRALFHLRSPEFEPGVWARRFPSLIVQRFWGDMGWYTARLHRGFIWAATIMLVVLIVAALARRGGTSRAPSTERRAPRPFELGVYLIPLAALAALVAQHSFTRYHQTGAIRFAQGRYLFGAIVPLAAVVGSGATRLSRRWAIPALAAWVVLVNADAFVVMLTAWWGRPDASTADRMAAVAAWNPFAGWVVAGVALALAVSFGWLGLEVVRARRWDGLTGT